MIDSNKSLLEFAMSLNKTMPVVMRVEDDLNLAQSSNVPSAENETQQSQQKAKEANKMSPLRLNDSAFTCVVCQKHFGTKSHFDYHLKTHSVVKEFHCGICGKSFITQQALRVHTIVHKNHKGRPFSCDKCEKSFQTKQNLENHRNIHKGIKPFKCTICTKSFREKSTLTKHYKCHTKIKPYSCSLCDQTFSQSSSLQRHIQQKHQKNNPDYGGFLPALGAEVVAKELCCLDNPLFSN